MKKLAVLILMLCGSCMMLIGCNEGETEMVSESVSETESIVSEEVSEVPSGGEEILSELTSEVESEETSEEVSEPEIVDGVQKVYYETYEELLEHIDTIDETVIILFAFTDSNVEKGQSILYNGAHCTIEENFAITVKSPRTITSMTTTNESVLINDYDYNGVHEWDLGLYEVGTDIEVPLTITYEDGTEETFIVYITKEWEYDWEDEW